MGELAFAKSPYHAPEDLAADEPDDSTILFQLVEGDSYMFPLGAYVDFWEFQSEGKAAFWENEASMLQDAVAGMLNIDQCRPGWWVMEKFSSHYTKSYEGEVDCDYDHEAVRPARWSGYFVRPAESEGD